MTLGNADNVVRGLLVSFSLTLSFAAAAQTADEAARAAFIDKMVEHLGFDRAEVTSLIETAVIDQTILTTMSRPAERVVPSSSTATSS